MSAIRTQLRDKVKARLQLIRQGQQVTIRDSGKAHAFASDIGSDVISWRIGDVLPDEMPCCGFADQEAEGDRAGSSRGEQGHGLNVEIVGFVKDADADSEALAALATGALLDILAAIGSDPEWDNLADAYTILTGTEIELHPDGRGIAAAIVRIRIDYTTSLWEV